MSLCFIDSRADSQEISALKELGMSVFLCPKSYALYDAISSHPDIQIHIIDKNNIIVQKDFPSDKIDFLRNLNINVYLSDKELQSRYPYDIPLNALNLKKYFIHNLKFTDKKLMELTKDKKKINTQQGYTKCSCAVVNDHAIITSDISIRNSLSKTDVDVLLIPPGNIELPGLDYGFIGGTCGLISKSRMAFFGDLSLYKYGDDIIKFLKKYNVAPIFLRKGPIIDRGSILTLF